MKKIFSIVKNLVFAPFIIYIYNLIAFPLGIIIPINIFTLAIVGLFGFSGLFTLIILYIVAF